MVESLFESKTDVDPDEFIEAHKDLVPEEIETKEDLNTYITNQVSKALGGVMQITSGFDSSEDMDSEKRIINSIESLVIGLLDSKLEKSVQRDVLVDILNKQQINQITDENGNLEVD